MLDASDNVGPSPDDADEDEGGQKRVKISIAKQLQAFRASKSSGSNVKLQRTQIVRQKIVDDEPVGAGLTIPEETPETSTPSSSGSNQVSQSTSGAPVEENESISENHDFSPMESQPSANVIRPIDRAVVHQICSGQVIVTLSTAVKELVENSIDSGATKIDIRLVENGSKLIEVSDDGSGIDEVNLEGLALKHHTSKISEFEDLESLSTFGFRGEALSSLCALSNLTVITRHKSSDLKIGYKIEYENSGRISSKTRCARECGTTVVLKDLFHTLPVRHREFNKNLKREFHRLINVLYGYCLVVHGVRISCTNQTGSAGPTKVIAVPAYNSMRERIVAVFGSKQLTSLIPIKQCETIPEEILAEYGLTEKTYERKYELEGYISIPNQGRSSNDRQFFFINSRPCDPVKISRVINEVYHGFSRQQNPFVCLHVKTNRENVDVNVTPDKRTLYVQNEKILLATLKATLKPMFADAASSFIPVNSQIPSSQLTFTRQSSQSQDNTLCLSSPFEVSSEEMETDDDTVTTFASQRSTAPVTFRTSGLSSSSSLGRKKITDFSAPYKRSGDFDRSRVLDQSKQPRLFSGALRQFELKGKRAFEGRKDETIHVENQDSEEEVNIQDSDDEGNGMKQSTNSSTYSRSFRQNVGEIRSNSREDSDDEDIEIVYDDEIEYDLDGQRDSRTITVSVDWKNISSALIARKEKSATSSSTISYARRFRAKISPQDNTSAEEELKKQLTKDMFGQMEILGQFNLGFIIVKNGPDLFIVDQHASDEKYNFEDLEKTTVLQGQPLISPLDLQLPAISENIIVDNVEVFQKNGFDFIISPDEEPTKRIKLAKIPYSRNTEFGKSDVEELIFMMEDASDKSFYRPTKIRQMFASRACRKSVMIGTALNPKDMRTIVDHMGDMEQPWNCPHGRPTIRHLINLNLLPDVDLTKFNH